MVSKKEEIKKHCKEFGPRKSAMRMKQARFAKMTENVSLNFFYMIPERVH